MVIWIVSSIHQGAIQGFQKKQKAEEFCEELGGAPIFKVNALSVAMEK